MERLVTVETKSLRHEESTKLSQLLHILGLE
jgi:hypothetical protein